MMQDNTARMLADQLDRLLADRVTPQLIAATEAGQGAGELDTALAGLGLDLGLVPEDAGGAGLGWRDLGEVFQTLGYHAAPTDLGERIVANHLLAALGQDPAEGAVAIGLDPLTLSGGKVGGTTFTPWGAATGLVLAATDAPDGPGVCVLDASHASATPVRSVGRVPSQVLTFADAPVIAAAKSGPIGPLEMLAVLRAAQIAGGLSRILELCIEHGNTRVQFGRPIGKFQAVQHLVAELAGEAGCAKAGAELALAALDAGRGWEAVAVAKIRASRAVARGAAVAHEVHGAIGVTEEHMLHNYTRRLWQWRDEAGDENAWSERLGRVMIAQGGRGLWPAVVQVTGG